MVNRLYFVIIANELLRHRMVEFGSDMASLLIDDQLWSALYPDRSNWSKSSLAVAAKLMYLAHLRKEYSLEAECSIIFDGPSITEATFDKWWAIITLELDETLEDVASDLDAAVLDVIAKTGIYAVDQWVDSLRRSPKN